MSPQVTDVGAVLEYACTDSGLFTVPAALPACRTRRACEAPPTPNLGRTKTVVRQTTKEDGPIGLSCARAREVN